MNTIRTPSALAARVLLVATAVLGSASCLAATSAAPADPPARSRCAHGPSTDGHVGGCMSKADAQVMRSRQAALDRDPGQYVRNALVRCERLSGDDRQDCVSRIGGQGTTSGSVEGGGIYRELVTREAGAVPAPVDAAK
jgi:hypothetical protein